MRSDIERYGRLSDRRYTGLDQRGGALQGFPGPRQDEDRPFWACACDDRPLAGKRPPGVAYVYAPDRKAERPIPSCRLPCRSTTMAAM
ncbi:MAG: hypothetical protein E5X04_00810, partial [Mesorhizobium sp.]